jgi:hypothetical protein
MNERTPEQLHSKVREWCAEHAPRAKLYRQDEWINRGETIGADSSLTILDQYELHEAWNRDPFGESSALFCDLLDLANCHGYRHEIGYRWTLHFYPVSVDDQ